MSAEVLIVGGGVAALEAALALGDLASDRAAITLLAPDADFVYRPPAVGAPFSRGGARHYPLAALVADLPLRLIADGLAWVDPDAGAVHTRSGATLGYDKLVLALGATPYARFPHALTLDARRLDVQLHGIVQDIEGGTIHSVAFVVPDRMAWPLPIYELALMTAEAAYAASARLKITLITSEQAPLAVFGDGASAAVAGLLDEAGVEVVAAAFAQVPRAGVVEVSPGHRRVRADRVIALPELMGPAVRGLPGSAHGFLPVDPFGRLPGHPSVYAAGDATDGEVKHGGMAAQQADTVALSIAAALGADVTPLPLRAELHAVLLTGRAPLYLSASAGGRHGFDSVVFDHPTWSSSAKIAARYLAPFLEDHDAAALPA